MRKLLIPVLLLLFAFQYDRKEKITVWMAGDSTMSVKDKKAYPETGWGMPFAGFFDSTVEVKNIAKNGRSTRTFLSEGLWQSIASNLKKGDYVFIQFGHNDESKEKTERYTTPEQYRENLLKFINETKDKGAIPVLLTPVSRRKFKDGIQVETHEVYSAVVRDLAKETGVSLIDADAETRKLYQELGEQPSRLLFLQLKKDEHPNYPEGKEDNTHFTELGARLVAQLVLKQIKKDQPELASRINVVKPK